MKKALIFSKISFKLVGMTNIITNYIKRI